MNRIYGLCRQRIAEKQRAGAALFTGTVAVDERCFGALRPRGVPGKPKRGRGTPKRPVFGGIERDGRVYAEIVPDGNKTTLQQVIRGRSALDATIVPDGGKACDGLVDVGDDRQLRWTKAYGKGMTFPENGVHGNGIEGFWSFTKRRLARFNGVARNFELPLRECEWRWGKDHDPFFKVVRLLV